VTILNSSAHNASRANERGIPVVAAAVLLLPAVQVVLVLLPHSAEHAKPSSAHPQPTTCSSFRIHGSARHATAHNINCDCASTLQYINTLLLPCMWVAAGARRALGVALVAALLLAAASTLTWACTTPKLRPPRCTINTLLLLLLLLPCLTWLQVGGAHWVWRRGPPRCGWAQVHLPGPVRH
jgi:hypothetical protein